jgi:hypothetical protein
MRSTIFSTAAAIRAPTGVVSGLIFPFQNFTSSTLEDVVAMTRVDAIGGKISLRS